MVKGNNEKLRLCLENLERKWGDLFRAYFNQSSDPLSKHDQTEATIQHTLKILMDLVKDFVDGGLADNHFLKEIQSTEYGKYNQRLSEVLAAHYFKRNGFTVSSNSEGPDLQVEKDGERAWVEVVTPVKSEYCREILDVNINLLEPSQGEAEEYNRERLLKVTSSIGSKSEKIKNYIENGIISSTDPVIIWINTSLLYWGEGDLPVGLTELNNRSSSNHNILLEALKGFVSTEYFHEEGVGITGFEVEVSKDRCRKIIKVDSHDTESFRCVDIPVKGFDSEELSHISAVMLSSLNEAYALGLVVNQLRNEQTGKNYRRMDYEGTPLLLMNENAQAPLKISLMAYTYNSEDYEWPLKGCDYTHITITY